jgi:hypothetical protein
MLIPTGFLLIPTGFVKIYAVYWQNIRRVCVNPRGVCVNLRGVCGNPLGVCVNPHGVCVNLRVDFGDSNGIFRAKSENFEENRRFRIKGSGFPLVHTLQRLCENIQKGCHPRVFLAGISTN